MRPGILMPPTEIKAVVFRACTDHRGHRRGRLGYGRCRTAGLTCNPLADTGIRTERRIRDERGGCHRFWVLARRPGHIAALLVRRW